MSDARNELLLLQRALETAMEATSRLTAQGTYVMANRAYASMLGYEPQELVGMSWEATVHPEDLGLAKASYARMIRTGKDEFEGRAVRKDGSTFHKQVVMVAIRGADGSFTGHYCFTKDVTPRREAEERLRKSELQLARAQAVAQVGSWEWDVRTRKVHASAEFLRMVGATDYREGGSYDLLWGGTPPDERERVTRAIERVYETRTATRMEYRAMLQGIARQLELRIEPELEADGALSRILGTVQDVTELRLLESKLRTAERVAALGTVVAGVAHEINNPLAFVSGNLTYLRERLAERGASDLSEIAAKAEEGVERIQRIVRDLKSLSREDATPRRAFSLQPVVSRALESAREALAGVDVVLQLAEIGPLQGDPERLCQVLVNLLINASHALKEKREGRQQVTVVAFAQERHAVLEVRDTGVGIPPAILPRIFEPFFTTKPVGVGTGLGLAVSQALMKAMGGALTVHSAPGEGSVFRLRLCFAQQPVQERAAPAPERVSPSSTGGRVLLVDDEKNFGFSLKLLLQDEHHFESTTAASEALETIRAGARYDVILCDLMMPKMSGMQLFHALSEACPEQAARMIFLTGGAFGEEAQRFLRAVPNPCLEKPLRADVLRGLIREKLAANQL